MAKRNENTRQITVKGYGWARISNSNCNQYLYLTGYNNTCYQRVVWCEIQEVEWHEYDCDGDLVCMQETRYVPVKVSSLPEATE